MLPIVGPTIKNSSFPFGSRQRQTYRQAKPYDRPLPYSMTQSYGTDHAWDTDGNNSGLVKNDSYSWVSDPSFDKMEQHAFNKAYEKLKAKLGDTAGWAENLAQIDKSRKLLVDRCVQLGNVASSIRRGNFYEAVATLNVPWLTEQWGRRGRLRGPTHRKNAAGQFLELEYGIKPVISDIQATVDFLIGAHFGDKYIKGSSTESKRTVFRQQTVQTNGWSLEHSDSEWRTEVTCRTGYRVTNPNLFLANQLGLLDLALPWKLIPFSFIVDWFVNVEQVISSLTDWYGVQLIHPHTTYYRTGRLDRRTWAYLRRSSTSSVYTQSVRDQERVELVRQLGISKPTLAVRPFRGFSVTRGAQAIALVVAVLDPGRASTFSR